jgi:hypothetical protein
MFVVKPQDTRRYVTAVKPEPGAVPPSTTAPASFGVVRVDHGPDKPETCQSGLAKLDNRDNDR